MIEPSGPLPPSVYWRRRAVAAGVSVLAVAMLAWIIGGLVGADDETPVRGTAGSSHLAAQHSSVRQSETRSAPPSSRASAAAESSAARASSGEPAPPAQPTTQPAPPPGPPQPCPDAVTKVDARAEAPSYQVGQQPLLTLIVSNVGPVPCTRDVGRQLRELLVTSADGTTRLWSSNDCFAPPGADVQLLQPNQSLFFSLNWAGRTSAQGCPENRTVVPAGTYRVVGKLGPLVGSWVPLVIT